MVFSIEPGIYLSADGPEILSSLPRDPTVI